MPPSQTGSPGPDENGEWDVDRIPSHTGYGATTRYTVLWNNGEVTEEPRSNLANAQEVLAVSMMRSAGVWLVLFGAQRIGVILIELASRKALASLGVIWIRALP